MSEGKERRRCRRPKPDDEDDEGVQEKKKPRVKSSSGKKTKKRKANQIEAINVGTIVTVREERMTGDGGVGRVTGVHCEGREESYDVRMVVDGQWLKKVAAKRLEIGDHSGRHYAMKTERYKVKVDEFLADPKATVLKVDDLVDKRNAKQVRYLLNALLCPQRTNYIQIAFFQGTLPLQEHADLLELFCQWLMQSKCDSSSEKKESDLKGWHRKGHKYLGRSCRLENGLRARVIAWKPADEARYKVDKWSPYLALFALVREDHYLRQNYTSFESMPEPDLEASLLDPQGSTSGGQSSHNNTIPSYLWSLNLGELRFSSEQLVYLADALAESAVTHMFYECNNLFATTFTPKAQFISPRAVEAAAKARKGKEGWKDTFRNIVRANRRKHDLYLYKSERPQQNLIVHQAVKNWFCPWGHEVNKQWLAEHGEESHLYSHETETRETAGCGRSQTTVIIGDRVLLTDDPRRGTVARLLAQGKQFIVAFDEGGCRTLSTSASSWRFEDLPRVHDVVRYQWSEAWGMTRLPRVPAVKDVLRHGVLLTLFSRVTDCEFWYNAETGNIRCPPLQKRSTTSHWTIEFPGSSTGAAALNISRRLAKKKVNQIQIPPPIDAKIQVKTNEVWLDAIVTQVGKERIDFELPDFFSPKILPQKNGISKHKEISSSKNHASSFAVRPRRTQTPRDVFRADLSSTELSKRLREDAAICEITLQTNQTSYRAQLGRQRFNSTWRYSETSASDFSAVIGPSAAQAVKPFLKDKSAKSKVINTFIHLAFRDRDDPVRILKVIDSEWYRSAWYLLVRRCPTSPETAPCAPSLPSSEADEEAPPVLPIAADHARLLTEDQGTTDSIDDFDRETIVDEDEYDAAWRYPHSPLTLFTEKLIALAPASLQTRTCLYE